MQSDQKKLQEAMDEIQKIKKEFMNQMSMIQLEYDKKIQAILNKHQIDKISKTIK